MARETDDAGRDDRTGDDEVTESHEASARRRRRLLTIVPGALLAGLLAYGLLAPAPESSGPRAAPEFELPLLTGSGSLSSEDLKGDPVVINFWASWCIPCREEMPAFERMWQKYRDDGIHIVGVNIQDSAAGGREFVEELGITYPVVYDAESSLARELDVVGLPQTFFIDRNYEFAAESRGRVLEGEGDRVVLGAISQRTLEKNILALLND